MAEFRQGVITNRGLDLLARAQAGTARITFTKAMIGNGVWAADTPEETIVAATALRNARGEFPVARAAFVDEGTSYLTVIANNANNNSGYSITEVGVYATDGTTEVLYSIYLATTPDWFPAYNSVTPYSITYTCYITVANAIDVTVATHTMELDDSAGAGDTDKVWSADKITDELALKADKTDTVLALKGSTTEVTGNTTATVSLTGLTANHIICDWGLSLGDVGNPPADIEIVPGSGSYTITVTNYGGTAFTITPVFVLPQ